MGHCIASATAYAADPARTGIASKPVPMMPAANSVNAKSPAIGRSASAACADDVMFWTPAVCRLTAAVSLHTAGIENITSSAQAAEALRPIAGDFAFILFAAGIVGTGLLAIPVLAGSAAYAVAESMNWPIGHGRMPRDAKGFYAIITVSTALGVALGFTPIDPIKALVATAVINGVVAVPIMVVMMRMAARPDIMGPFMITRRLRRLGWAATVAMGIAVAGMLVSYVV